MSLPVFDNENSATAGFTTGVTIPAFLLSGSNRGVFVGVGTSAGSLASTTTVVRNATSPEALDEKWDFNNGANFHGSGHWFTNPVAGSFSITVTLSALQDDIAAGAASFTNVHQTIAPSEPTKASGTAGTVAAIVHGANAYELVIDTVYAQASPITVGADQTVRWQENNVTGVGVSGGCSTQDGATVTIDEMTWTWTGGAQWVIGAMAIRATDFVPDAYQTGGRFDAAQF